MKRHKGEGISSRQRQKERSNDLAPREPIDDQLRQTVLSGGSLTMLGDSPAAQAGHLTDSRFLDTQRRQIAGQIGVLQGNSHLGRVATVQRDVPNITEPAAPDIPGLDPATRTRLLGPVRAFHGDRSVANGRAAVDAIVTALDPSSVQYRNQTDITPVSPQFRDAPSGDAVHASVQATGSPPTQQLGGFAFMREPGPPPVYQVEIYPEAFLRGTTPEEMLSYVAGVIIHEFVHVQQFRRQAGGAAGGSERFSEAHLEFQAWLWQAEHVDELGIRPGTRGFNEITSHLREFYEQMPAADKTRYRPRLARVIYRAYFYQCQSLASAGLAPPQSSIDGLRRYFGWMPAADRSQHNAEYQALLQTIRQVQEQAAAGGGT